jgi:hypothetical protein
MFVFLVDLNVANSFMDHDVELRTTEEQTVLMGSVITGFEASAKLEGLNFDVIRFNI